MPDWPEITAKLPFKVQIGLVQHGGPIVVKAEAAQLDAQQMGVQGLGVIGRAVHGRLIGQGFDIHHPLGGGQGAIVLGQHAGQAHKGGLYLVDQLQHGGQCPKAHGAGDQPAAAPHQGVEVAQIKNKADAGIGHHADGVFTDFSL